MYFYIVAVSPKGKGWIYNGTTAHEVQRKEAYKIAEVLNTDERFASLKTPEQEWSVHTIDKYDGAAYDAAIRQRFFLSPYGLVRGVGGERYFPRNL